MQWNTEFSCEHAEVGLITISNDEKILLNGIQLRCGKRIGIWREDKSEWQLGRIRYSSKNGYCFFSEETGEIRLEEEMKISIG